MDASHEGMLHGGLSSGGSRMLSHLDDVGADVRLRARFADLANEIVYSAKGDPVPVLDRAGLEAPACIVDVELAAMTLGHLAHSVSLDPFEAALQELKTTVRRPHGGANYHGIVTADVLAKGLSCGTMAMRLA